MELKPGYKQTEVGVIPEEWDVVLLDSVARRGSGHTPDKAHPEYWGGDIKWVSLTDSQRLDNLYISETSATITAEGIANSSANLLPAGSCIVTRDAGVGKSAILAEPMAVSQHFMAWHCGPRLSNHYLYFLLQAMKPELERIAIGNTIKTIGLPYFKSLRIQLPSLAEQNSIALALTEVDQLIRELERSVTKKQGVKQATMQELLTGKRRLPGFEGEWETVAISQIAEKITGFWGRTEPGNEAIHSTNVIRAGDISEDGRLIGAACRYLSHHEISVAGCRSGDTVMTASGNGLGKSWTCTQNGVYSASNFVRIIRPLRGKADGHFIGYALKSRRSRSKLIEHTATSAYPNLKPSFFKDSWLPLPPEAEQKAISRVLQDIDIEILELEARKLKASQLKQGMMQQLLTGKIRLK